jgi:hypothetical protein
VDPVGIAGTGGGALTFGCKRSAALADAVVRARIAASATHGFLISAPAPPVCHQFSWSERRQTCVPQEADFLSFPCAGLSNQRKRTASRPGSRLIGIVEGVESTVAPLKSFWRQLGGLRKILRITRTT